MGIHSKQRAEQQRAKEARRQMATRVTAVAAAIGVSAVVGIQVKDKLDTDAQLEPLNQAKNAYVNTYGCKQIGNVALKIAQKTENDTDGYGLGGEVVASTKNNRIVVSKQIPLTKAKGVIAHEMVHACSDKLPKPFSRTFKTRDGTEPSGASGFRIWFKDSTEAKPNTFNFIDEGAAEWIAQGVEGSVISSNNTYTALRETTALLAGRANLSRDQLAKMVQESDVLGFISAVNGVTEPELTDSQVDNFIFIYNDAFTTEHAPNTYDLSAHYAISSLHR